VEGTPPVFHSEAIHVALSQPVWQTKPANVVTLKACEDVLRERLTPSFEKLFAELTGLRLHVSWQPPLASQTSSARLILCPAARRKGSLSALPRSCRTCLEQNWTAIEKPTPEGRRFVGHCGAVNFCTSLQVGSAPPRVMLLLQAQFNGGGSALRRKAGAALESFLWKQPEVQHAPLRLSKAPGVSKAAFDRAVALVRLIREELEASVQAWMTQSELGQLRSRVQNLEAENSGLHEAACETSPEMPGASTVEAPVSHTQRIVREMMAYVQQHYHRPMSLGDVAAALEMNAAYLSSLFSATAGMTFHKFLEGARFTKARELLRNPHSRICEVACAVGYASAGQFRHAFKGSAGVPPSAWR
jgi:AraC-like DNA-binding protein